MSQPKQIKLIHTLKNALRLEEDDYRRWLGRFDDSPQPSSKNLSFAAAQRFISELQAQAVSAGVWNFPTRRPGSRADKKRYEELGKRPGMATPKQLRMVEAMWADVSRQSTAEKRYRSLQHFLMRIVGVADMRFLTGWMVGKVVKALEAMGATAPR